jgi:adenylate cyclase
MLPSVTVMRWLIAFVAVSLTVASESLPSRMVPDLANEWLRDRFVRMQASSEPDARIAVIDIDELSLASLGPWPWPRARIADLIESLLTVHGARAVALDLVLPEPADTEGDTRLSILAQHGPVVLAQAFDYVERVQSLSVGVIAGGQPGPAPGAASARGYIANHAQFAQARHVGNIGFVPDDDGTIRRLPMLTSFDGRVYATLSRALLQCCDPAAADLPLQNGVRRVPYQRAWSAYTVIPASAVLKQQAPSSLIAGRLVIVGSSSLGLTDRVATPLSTSTAGMLVHVAMLSSLLDEQAGNAPMRLPGRLIAILYVLAITALATYTFPRLSAMANVGLVLGTSVAWVALAFWLSPFDPDFSTTAPLASHLFLLAVAVPFDWQLTQRKSRQLLGTLRQYVAEAVVDELLRRDMKDPLTPRRLDVTTLIADMEGYTGQVEALSMEEAAQLTRDFLACLTRPVLEKHGTLDKFTGDGLVAFWGAPLPIEDHADLALEAAKGILEEVRRFSEAREMTGKKPLRVRIGIESGVAMAGDFGTPSRSIYTAVGDSVNVASRLEQMGRDYPYSIIIGQGTVSRSKRHAFKLLGERLLRGKEHVTILYTLELNT